MNRKNDRTKSKIFSTKSQAEKLMERLATEKGKRFNHQDFHPLDPESLVVEKTFHELGQTVQVHLTRGRKVEAVYLIRGQ